MALFRFDRDFPWLGPVKRKCILCKALGIWDFKKSAKAIEIPEDAALAAEQAGAGQRVTDER